jgi:hypothetical protein
LPASAPSRNIRSGYVGRDPIGPSSKHTPPFFDLQPPVQCIAVAPAAVQLS